MYPPGSMERLADLDLVRVCGGARCVATLDQQPQAGIQLGRPGAAEHDVAHPPVGADDREPAFAEDEQHRGLETGGTCKVRQVLARLRQIVAAVHHDHIGIGGADSGAGIRWTEADAMVQQGERRYHRSPVRGRGGQQQQISHARSSRPEDLYPIE